MTSFYPPPPQVNASLPQYATAALLPVSATNGDLVIVLDTNSLYLYDSAWIEICSGDTYPVSLQRAYDSPGTPLILQSAAKGGITFRQGSGQTGNLFTLENSSGITVASISVAGVLTLATTTGVLHSNGSGVISSSAIVNADVDAAAAIGLSKLATGALPSGITVSSANIVDGTIVNADVNASAAIAGTKINPNFGSQNIDTTGGVYPSLVDATLSLKAPDIYGSLDAYSVGGTLSIGTANANTINIGTGPTTNTITLGGVNDTVVVAGTLTTVNTTNLEVADKNIVLNKGGLTSSAGLAGIDFEEGGSITGYVRASSTRTSLELKAPATAGEIELVPAAFDTIVTATSTSIRSLSLPDVSGTLISNGDTGTVTSAMIANATIVNADISPSAAIAGTKIEAASGSVPGVVSTGTQTLAGAKTLSGITTVFNSTASTSSTTGALVVTGGVGVGEVLTVAADMRSTAGVLDLGKNRASAGASFIDLTTTNTNPDFDARIIRNSGANGTFQLLQGGTSATEIRNSISTSTGDGTLIQGYRAGAPTTGYVGEVTTSTASGPNLVAGATYVTNASMPVLILGPGVWLLKGAVYFSKQSDGQTWLTYNTIAADGPVFYYSYVLNAVSTILEIGTGVVYPTSTTTYRLYAQTNSGTVTIEGNSYTYLQAVRIA